MVEAGYNIGDKIPNDQATVFFGAADGEGANAEKHQIHNRPKELAEENRVVAALSTTN